jgi:hypothetical protein
MKKLEIALPSYTALPEPQEGAIDNRSEPREQWHIFSSLF